MATLAVETISRAGLSPTMVAAAAGGDDFINDGKTFVFIKNANVSVARVITLDIQATVDGQLVTDRTVSLAASAEAMIGPFPIGDYNDANQKMKLTYDVETDLTIGVMRLGT